MPGCAMPGVNMNEFEHMFSEPIPETTGACEDKFPLPVRHTFLIAGRRGQDLNSMDV